MSSLYLESSFCPYNAEVQSACTLTVSSNYYWRLKAPAWLDVQTPQFYFPDEWEVWACGYAGRRSCGWGFFALPLVRGRAGIRGLSVQLGCQTVALDTPDRAAGGAWLAAGDGADCVLDRPHLYGQIRVDMCKITVVKAR